MSNRKWLVVGIVVVLVIVLVVVYFFVGRKPAPGTPVFVPTGQVVPEFPKELLLNHDADFSQSYSINYSSSTNQYTAIWNASSSVADVYNEYLSYFQTNGWDITNRITRYTDSRGLYATNGTSTVNVAIVAQGAGAQVIISYLP